MYNCTGGNSLFGAAQSYIKFLNSDAVAINGSNVTERMILSDLRIPYKQILKSRVILKSGQQNYLLNHLGLGDNATFLMLVVRFDPKSKIEDDNYIRWNYFNDSDKIFTSSKLLVLTGNSTNRIPQLYLHNPNEKYPVSIDVMVAVVDDVYSFFPDPDNVPPVIYFTENVLLNGATGSFTSEDSGTFSSEMSLSVDGGTQSILTKSIISNFIIEEVIDDRDGQVIINNGNIILLSGTQSITEITATGSYYVSFDISDESSNVVDPDLHININIIE